MVPPLYKFRSINEWKPEECFTLDSLRNSYVYFSNMTTLNDPFEMGVFLDQVSNLEDAQKEFMTGNWSGSPIGHALEGMQEYEREVFLAGLWEREEWREQFLGSWKGVDGFAAEEKENISVFCASATREDGLLWAHYASGHRGIAIELDPTRDRFLTVARKVVYKEEFPVIDMFKDDEDTRFEKGMLTKSIDWKYEQEYRAIFPALTSSERHRVHPSVFTSITFGAKVSECTRELVVEATRPRLSHVCFEQARLGKKSFSVKFEEYRVEG